MIEAVQIKLNMNVSKGTTAWTTTVVGRIPATIAINQITSG